MRYRKLGVYAVAVALMGTAACSQSQPDDGEGVRSINLTLSSTAMSSGPILAAITQDTFGDHGLEVNYTSTAGDSTTALATVASGQAPFATVGASTVIDAQQEGLPVQFVLNIESPAVTIAMRDDIAAEIMAETGVGPDSPIAERVEALRGLQIGAPPSGGANYTLLALMLNRNGIDPESDVTLLPSDQQTVVSGIKGDRFEVGFWSAGALEGAIVDGDAVKWIDVSAGDIPEFSDFLYMTAITSEDVINEDPELVNDFIASVRDGAQLLIDDDADTKAAIKEEFFPTLPDGTWDLTWDSARQAVIPNQTFTQEALDYTVEATETVYGRVYEDLMLADLVVEQARD
ncbi:ABC transporter substrate-binding protein [Ornithinimicrobium cryptoxanthini]|uniref:Thiamine pyrimidine synthase n=1 Tax=Ornithinimicrobium cryptoxanthini TaxID=2934161 RepID=A0ABY4YM59_9MICO|nr:ABC transporter substrate-binding protein [Ornithinimicrobium cryptoxanthini]USQ77814.1 ABC transporter substrate-binding protein [Ornithinimicrobium cryptoxanthini]